MVKGWARTLRTAKKGTLLFGNPSHAGHRLNFSVHSLSVRAPAADHFAQRLAESELIHAERIDLER